LSITDRIPSVWKTLLLTSPAALSRRRRYSERTTQQQQQQLTTAIFWRSRDGEKRWTSRRGRRLSVRPSVAEEWSKSCGNASAKTTIEPARCKMHRRFSLQYRVSKISRLTNYHQDCAPSSFLEYFCVYVYMHILYFTFLYAALLRNGGWQYCS